MAHQAAGAVYELETEMGVSTVTAIDAWLRVEARLRQIAAPWAASLFEVIESPNGHRAGDSRAES